MHNLCVCKISKRSKDNDNNNNNNNDNDNYKNNDNGNNDNNNNNNSKILIFRMVKFFFFLSKGWGSKFCRTNNISKFQNYKY